MPRWAGSELPRSSFARSARFLSLSKYAIILPVKSTRRWQIIALGALILGATALRFYRLNAQDIWGDEAFSIALSQQPLNVIVAGAADTHPPFYPLLLFGWLKLVGASAFAARALSAWIGVLAVPLIFVLAKRLTARPRVPWLAALLLALSPLLLYYSQETRMYEWVAVLSLWSVYLMLTLTQRGQASKPALGANRPTIFYLAITLLALYTHYSAFFVLAAENIFALIRFGKNRAAWLRWSGAQVLLIAAYIPWVVAQTAFLRGKASGRFSEWGWRGIEMIFGKTFLAFASGLTVDAPLAQVAGALFLIFAALGVWAIVAASKAAAQSDTNRSETDSANRLTEFLPVLGGRLQRSPALLAPIYFIVPVLIAYLVNPIMPFFFERYVLVALPGFILTIAFGLDYMAERSPRAFIGISGVIILLNAFALSNYYFDEAYAKGKYGQMMAYISANAQPGDAIILNNPLQKPLYDYYAPRNIPADYLPNGGVALEDPSSQQQLEALAKQSPRLWLVMFGNPAEYDPTNYLGRWLGAHAFKTYFGGFVDARLTLYVMPSAQPAIRRALNFTLGTNIRLTGYDLDRREVFPGQALQLTLHWQATAPIAQRYKVFAHVIGGVNPATRTPVWAQMDNEPMGDSHPTNAWQVGEPIDDRYGLMLPADIPPGDYLIEIGMYAAATQERLAVFDATGARLPDDRVVLGAARVIER